MKNRTKKILTTAGISFLVIASLVYGVLFASAAGMFKAITLKPRLDNILYHTDHEALLSACRSLIKEGYRGQYNLGWPDKHPDANKLPKEILALKATYVLVRDDCVKIEMWGGMSHYGVIAYAEDLKKPSEQYLLGNKAIIDGLWFYSDFIDLNAEK